MKRKAHLSLFPQQDRSRERPLRSRAPSNISLEIANSRAPHCLYHIALNRNFSLSTMTRLIAIRTSDFPFVLNLIDKNSNRRQMLFRLIDCGLILSLTKETISILYHRTLVVTSFDARHIVSEYR